MPWWGWLVVAWPVPGVAVAVSLREILNPMAIVGTIVFTPLFIPPFLFGRLFPRGPDSN